MRSRQILLLVTDASAIFLVTFIGIRFHQTDPSIITRLPFTFLPFFVAWIFFAAMLRAYDVSNASTWKQLWKIPVAAGLTAPLGVAIRSVWLNIPYVPIFAAVMGAALAIGLSILRSLFILIFANRWAISDNG